MNKMLFFLFVAAMVIGICGGAVAALTDQGDGTIYDDITGLYWYAGLAHFTAMTYQQQLDMIDDLGWGHLATHDEMQDLWSNYSASEIGSVFIRSGDYTSSYGTYYYAWHGRFELQAAEGEHCVAWIRMRLSNGKWFREVLTDWALDDSETMDSVGVWVASPSPRPVGYSVKSDGDDVLYRIDLMTGVATPVGTGVGFGDVEGLAFDPLTGSLFGIDGDDARKLITIDMTTGQGTEVGPLGYSEITNPGLAIDAAGNIFTVTTSYNGAELYSVNRDTGAVTWIGPLDVQHANGLAFIDDILYGVCGSLDALFTVSTENGRGTIVGFLGIDLRSQNLGLASDGAKLWAIDDTGIIVHIDPLTGAATQTATTDAGFEGLAIWTNPCTCDCEFDGDVDGADLANEIDVGGSNIERYAGEFGRTDCP
jgi:hypothetical protein